MENSPSAKDTDEKPTPSKYIKMAQRCRDIAAQAEGYKSTTAENARTQADIYEKLAEGRGTFSPYALPEATFPHGSSHLQSVMGIRGPNPHRR